VSERAQELENEFPQGPRIVEEVQNVTTKSKDFYSQMGDDLAIVATAVARVDAKRSKWTVGSERSEGDKA
jgi:hypothetical protein